MTKKVKPNKEFEGFLAKFDKHAANFVSDGDLVELSIARDQILRELTNSSVPFEKNEISVLWDKLEYVICVIFGCTNPGNACDIRKFLLEIYLNMRNNNLERQFIDRLFSNLIRNLCHTYMDYRQLKELLRMLLYFMEHLDQELRTKISKTIWVQLSYLIDAFYENDIEYQFITLEFVYRLTYGMKETIEAVFKSTSLDTSKIILHFQSMRPKNIESDLRCLINDMNRTKASVLSFICFSVHFDIRLQNMQQWWIDFNKRTGTITFFIENEKGPIHTKRNMVTVDVNNIISLTFSRFLKNEVKNGYVGTLKLATGCEFLWGTQRNIARCRKLVIGFVYTEDFDIIMRKTLSEMRKDIRIHGLLRTITSTPVSSPERAAKDPSDFDRISSSDLSAISNKSLIFGYSQDNVISTIESIDTDPESNKNVSLSNAMIGEKNTTSPSTLLNMSSLSNNNKQEYLPSDFTIYTVNQSMSIRTKVSLLSKRADVHISRKPEDGYQTGTDFSVTTAHQSMSIISEETLGDDDDDPHGIFNQGLNVSDSKQVEKSSDNEKGTAQSDAAKKLPVSHRQGSITTHQDIDDLSNCTINSSNTSTITPSAFQQKQQKENVGKIHVISNVVIPCLDGDKLIEEKEDVQYPTKAKTNYLTEYESIQTDSQRRIEGLSARRKEKSKITSSPRNESHSRKKISRIPIRRKENTILNEHRKHGINIENNSLCDKIEEKGKGTSPKKVLSEQIPNKPAATKRKNQEDSDDSTKSIFGVSESDLSIDKKKESSKGADKTKKDLCNTMGKAKQLSKRIKTPSLHHSMEDPDYLYPTTQDLINVLQTQSQHETEVKSLAAEHDKPVETAQNVSVNTNSRHIWKPAAPVTAEQQPHNLSELQKSSTITETTSSSLSVTKKTKKNKGNKSLNQDSYLLKHKTIHLRMPLENRKSSSLTKNTESRKRISLGTITSSIHSKTRSTKNKEVDKRRTYRYIYEIDKALKTWKEKILSGYELSKTKQKSVKSICALLQYIQKNNFNN